MTSRIYAVTFKRPALRDPITDSNVYDSHLAERHGWPDKFVEETLTLEAYSDEEAVRRVDYQLRARGCFYGAAPGNAIFIVTDVAPVNVAMARMESLTAAMDAAEALWGVVANASGGDWSKETPGWRAAAERAREQYHTALEKFRQ